MRSPNRRKILLALFSLPLSLSIRRNAFSMQEGGTGRSPQSMGWGGQSVQSSNWLDRFLDRFGMGPRSQTDAMGRDRQRSGGGSFGNGRGFGNFGRDGFNEK